MTSLEPSFDHLHRLSDDTGLYEHAIGAAPLVRTLRQFAGRHPHLADTFAEHFDSVRHRLRQQVELSA